MSCNQLSEESRPARAPVRSLCLVLANPSIFFLPSDFLKAGLMPKCARRNLRIFNGLEFAANSHRASGRETVSGWNTATSIIEPPHSAHKEFSLYASTDSLRPPQTLSPPA